MCSARAGDQDNWAPGSAPSLREHVVALFVILPALILAHAWLLRLPYFWDEAGYFIPAARDLLLTGDPIPHTTLSNAHPPLLMVLLAGCWKVFGYSPLVTRLAMLMVASLALLGVWRLACVTANRKSAIATVACVAFYPVFFAQSSLAHLDIVVTGLTIWGLAFYIERRWAASIILLALAPLAKETAVVTPLALLAWELLCLWVQRSGRTWPFSVPRAQLRHALSFLLCCIPLALWFLYHYHRTGFLLGNPEYLRYNLLATLSPFRILLAVGTRLWHVLGYMNLFALTILAAVAVRSRAVVEEGVERSRVSLGVQATFAVVILAHVLGMAVLGGAVLARYMLPVIPLMTLLCVNTLYRRMKAWRLVTGMVVAAFIAGIFVNPPYRFAPEDNLTYADYVVLHREAAAYLAAHGHGDRVLTAWPASDELTRPFLGYVSEPIPVVRIENFSQPEIQLAAAASGQYSWAYVFSTKYEPPRLLRRWEFWNRLLQRYFDDHVNVQPESAALQLGGKIVYRAQRRGEWIALIRIQRQVENAHLR